VGIVVTSADKIFGCIVQHIRNGDTCHSWRDTNRHTRTRTNLYPSSSCTLEQDDVNKDTWARSYPVIIDDDTKAWPLDSDISPVSI